MENIEVKAVSKSVRIAPRKVRLVVDLIRGKQVGEAISILKHTSKGASTTVEKLLNSAIANADHNNGMDVNNLYVKKVFVDEGQTLKRFIPRAKGMATPIMKRTSHITLIVAEKE